MAGGGGGQKASSTQTTEVKLPAWVDQASQSNYQRAQQVANRPYEAYGGDLVADWNPTLQQASSMLPQVGQYQGQYGQASNALQGLLNYNPQQIQNSAVRTGQLRDTDLTPYLNPYTSEVEANTVRQMQSDAARAQNQLSSDASAAKSFGGSRQAMQQAIQGAETTKKIGDTVSSLRSAGFTNAQAQAAADIDRAQKGDIANMQNWTDVQKTNAANELTARGLSRQAADSMVAAATAGQQSAISTLGQYLGVGQLEQAQSQRELDAARGQWQEERNYPLEQLNILLSSLGMSPYGKTETTTKSGKSEESAGAAGTAGGLLGTILPMMKYLPALGATSDRSVKTDIEKLGTDEELGLPVYSYRYKGDPKSYPKVTGLMAQDVEKKYPQFVRKVAGKRVIDLTHIAA